MKQILIADTTLLRKGNQFGFKEKIEIVRQLDKLGVDVIEIPAIRIPKTDILFVKTVSSFAKSAILSVDVGMDEQGIEYAATAVSVAAKARLRVALPVSTVGMEYTCHKKPPMMLELIRGLVAGSKAKCADVEFCAIDATRADAEFLQSVIAAAVEAGATTVTLCDSAAAMLPDDFAAFAARFAAPYAEQNICFGVAAINTVGLACAEAIMAVTAGAALVKTTVGGDEIPLDTFATIVHNCGNRYQFACGIKYTEMNRIINQIGWISRKSKNETTAVVVGSGDGMRFDKTVDRATLLKAVSNLGYDLSEEDSDKVFDEFLHVAAKRAVGEKELEAIVATTALQVPPTYRLVSYVVNNGNLMQSSAQIHLTKGEDDIVGICIGDGPIDAAFLAIEQVIGRHYELDDFQIQSVTEGKEAVGSALVKLKFDGKLYSGNGISTDIIGAAIRAYLNAVNKIVYEEA